MFLWRNKIEKKKRKGNQTPGRAKGENCKSSALDRHMAKSSRSYKHPLYGAWCEKMARRRGEMR